MTTEWTVAGQDWSEWSDNGLLLDHCKASTWILGKVEYQGAPYLVLWEGESKKGPACKLAHPDGKPLLFALASEVHWLERYPGKGATTFGQLVRDSAKED